MSPRVRVTIVSDRAIPWATTGEQIGGSGTTKTFEARNVRDFTIVGAPDFRVTSATVGGVAVHVWGRPGFASASVLSAAKTALAREAALLGPYPYLHVRPRPDRGRLRHGVAGSHLDPDGRGERCLSRRP